MSAKMHELAAFVRLDSTESGPPQSFRLFKLGDNRTSKGNFTVTAESAAQCMAAAADYENDLSIDYCHAIFAENHPAPDEAGKAAGWFSLALREDGLYAENVRWTPKASKMLADREYRYTSPAFLTEKQGGKRVVVRVANVALTNIPASHGLQPLVASQRGEAAEENDMLEKLSGLLGLPEDAPEADVLSTIGGLKDQAKTLLDLLGAKDGAEAASAVGALHQNVASLVSERDLLSASVAEANSTIEALQAKVATDAKAAHDAQVKSLLDGAVASNRITPHERVTLSKKADDLEWLKEFVGKREAKAPVPVEPSTDAGMLSQMKWEELGLAKKHELKFENPALYDALRADYLARSGK